MSVTETTIHPIARTAVDLEVTINATPARVFHALLHETALWWGRDFTSVPNASQVTIESSIGGRFFEADNAGNGRLWGRVQRLEADHILEIRGPMAIDAPIEGIVCFTLTPEGDKTLLRLDHTVVGPVDPEILQHYKGGWTQLLGTHLTKLVESGEKLGLGA